MTQAEYMSNASSMNNSERLLAVESWLEASINSFSLATENKCVITKDDSTEHHTCNSVISSMDDQLLGGETGSLQVSSTPTSDSSSGAAALNYVDVPDSERNEMESSFVPKPVEKSLKDDKENDPKPDSPSTTQEKILIFKDHNNECEFSPTISRMPPDGHEFPPEFDDPFSSNKIKYDSENTGNMLTEKTTEKEFICISNNLLTLNNKNVFDLTKSEMESQQILMNEMNINLNQAKKCKIIKNLADENINRAKHNSNGISVNSDVFEFQIFKENNEEKILHEKGISIEGKDKDSQISGLKNKHEVQHTENPDEKNKSLIFKEYDENDENNMNISQVANDNKSTTSICYDINSFKEVNKSKHFSNIEINTNNTKMAKTAEQEKDKSQVNTETARSFVCYLDNVQNKENLNFQTSQKNKLLNGKFHISVEDAGYEQTKSNKDVEITECSPTENKKILNILNNAEREECNDSTNTSKLSVKWQDSSTSLYSLLESRRQQVTKLKGLVIPEKSESQMSTSCKKLPIPLIKSSKNSNKLEISKFKTDHYYSLPRGIGLGRHCGEKQAEIRTQIKTQKIVDGLDDFTGIISNKDFNNKQQFQDHNKNLNDIESQFKLTKRTSLDSSQNGNKLYLSSNYDDTKEKDLNWTYKCHDINKGFSQFNFNNFPDFSSSNVKNHLQSSRKPELKLNSTYVNKNKLQSCIVEKLHSESPIISTQYNPKNEIAKQHHQNLKDQNGNLQGISNNNQCKRAPVSGNEYSIRKTKDLNDLQYDNKVKPMKESVSTSIINDNTCLLRTNLKQMIKRNLDATSETTNKKWEELQKKYNHQSPLSDTTSSLTESNENPQHVLADPQFKPKLLSHQVTVLNNDHLSGDSVKSFKALAEQWEQRSQDIKCTEGIMFHNTNNTSCNSTSMFAKINFRAKDAAFFTNNCKSNERRCEQQKHCSTDILDKIPLYKGDKLINELDYSKAPYKKMLQSKYFLNDTKVNNPETYFKDESSFSHELRNINNEVQRISTVKRNALETQCSTAISSQCDNKSRSSSNSFSSQELQNMIVEVKQTLQDDERIFTLHTVIFHHNICLKNIGITLDDENCGDSEHITILKITNGSLADNDERIKEGDQIISINGKLISNLSHAEVSSILNAYHQECILILLRKGTETR